MPLLLLTTLLVLSALYAPQPLLPVLAQEFALSTDAAALLVTLVFVPLSLAPLGFGYLLQAVQPKRVLQVGMGLLLLTEFAFAAAGSYPLLLALRLLQGLLVPALLTALMTAFSLRSGEVQRGMAVYVTATIIGGFLGRFCAGSIATLFGWRWSFIVLGVSMIFALILLMRLPDQGQLELARPRPKLLLEVLQKPGFLPLYLGVFCLFLIFAAVMNFLPFRLLEMSKVASEFRIGLMYSGYLMGAVTSLNAPRLAGWLGGEGRAMQVGFTCYLIAIVGLVIGRVEVFFLLLFFFCGAMFLVHATASGLLNRAAAGHKGMVNGLYVAFYYGGGVVGSSLPGPVYHHFGWHGVIFLLTAVGTVGLFLVGLSWRRWRFNT